MSKTSKYNLYLIITQNKNIRSDVTKNLKNRKKMHYINKNTVDLESSKKTLDNREKVVYNKNAILKHLILGGTYVRQVCRSLGR